MFAQEYLDVFDLTFGYFWLIILPFHGDLSPFIHQEYIVIVCFSPNQKNKNPVCLINWHGAPTKVMPTVSTKRGRWP